MGEERERERERVVLCAKNWYIIYLSSTVQSLCFHSTLPPSFPPSLSLSLSLTHTHTRTHARTHFTYHIPAYGKRLRRRGPPLASHSLLFFSGVFPLSLSNFLSFLLSYFFLKTLCFFLLYINLSLNVNRETALNFDQCDYPFSFFIAFSLWLPCFSLF